MTSHILYFQEVLSTFREYTMQIKQDFLDIFNFRLTQGPEE